MKLLQPGPKQKLINIPWPTWVLIEEVRSFRKSAEWINEALHRQALVDKEILRSKRVPSPMTRPTVLQMAAQAAQASADEAAREAAQKAAQAAQALKAAEESARPSTNLSAPPAIEVNVPTKPEGRPKTPAGPNGLQTEFMGNLTALKAFNFPPEEHERQKFLVRQRHLADLAILNAGGVLTEPLPPLPYPPAIASAPVVAPQTAPDASDDGWL